MWNSRITTAARSLLTVVVLAAASGPVSAAETETWTVSVPVYGLNLSTPGGAAAFRHRMMAAVKSQYGADGIGQPTSSVENSDLERQALKQALARADKVIDAAQRNAAFVLGKAATAG